MKLAGTERSPFRASDYQVSDWGCKGGGGKKDKKGKVGGGGLSEEDKARIAARADRFGTSTAPAGGEKKRPAVEVAPVDPEEEEERRKKRAARFGLA